MSGAFYVTGLVIPSKTGRSYSVFALYPNGQRIFIGLISKKAVSALLQKQIPQADICKFSSVAAQEPLELEP
jgi:hypothetical protein